MCCGLRLAGVKLNESLSWYDYSCFLKTVGYTVKLGNVKRTLDGIVISLRDPGPTAGRDVIFTRTERGKGDEG